jgi:hypothetical protein
MSLLMVCKGVESVGDDGATRCHAYTFRFVFGPTSHLDFVRCHGGGTDEGSAESHIADVAT